MDRPDDNVDILLGDNALAWHDSIMRASRLVEHLWRKRMGVAISAETRRLLLSGLIDTAREAETERRGKQVVKPSLLLLPGGRG